MRIIFGLGLFLMMYSCAMTSPKQEKINGVSFVASRDSINNKHIDPVLKLNANYAAIMPFGFIKDLQHPEVVFNSERQWFGETKAGTKQYIEALKKQHIKAMMKPQIWVWRGEFTGLINMKTEEEWLQLEHTYSNFILEYAQVAQDTHTELFCIGTELEAFVANRPKYWSHLITEIKKIYKGKLTYAANWNEYTKTPFWDQLDYIGIDAYFPLSDKPTPTLQECREGWNTYKTEIKAYSEQFNKPILFTEFGYRSVDHTAKAPWNSDIEMVDVNMDAQLNATCALFDEFWKEDWFAGGFIWKWFHNYEESGGKNDNQFTPQNKPVEEMIRTYYGSN
ncbi:glycoside hydrolase family 113 [Flavobacteriaceae bacterium LMO-SS05]